MVEDKYKLMSVEILSSGHDREGAFVEVRIVLPNQILNEEQKRWEPKTTIKKLRIGDSLNQISDFSDIQVFNLYPQP